MSSRQFEKFLAQCFIEWASGAIQPGFRYQFKSPNVQNSNQLFEAFLEHADGRTIAYREHQHPYVECNGTRLIPVLHHEDGEGFTEHYISHLRDQIAARNDAFSEAALFIIHNSMLDTLINSAMDVSSKDAIWHPTIFATKLKAKIPTASPLTALFNCLLDDQLSIIQDEGATIFGFKPIFYSLNSGQINYAELGLFPDPLLPDLGSQLSQVRNRIDSNRQLRSFIADQVEHYAERLDSVLTKFSPKFIQEHFYDKNDWINLTFTDYQNELDKSKTPGLQFERVTVDVGIVFSRAKSSTKAGQKEQNILIQVPPGATVSNLEFVFLGNDLQDHQVVIRHNSSFQRTLKPTVSRLGGKYSKARLSVPFYNIPTYFSLELRRDNNSEDFKFRCLLVPMHSFYLDVLKNCFKVEPAKEQISLQLEENIFRVAELGDQVFKLQEDQSEINCEEIAIIDFEEQASKNELIQFTVISGTHRLKINIEGLSAQETITVPLLFDKERSSKLFSDKSNAEYLSGRHRVVFENAEHTVIGVRQQLLDFENTLIAKDLLSYGIDDQNFNIDSLAVIFPELSNAYKSLFKYYKNYKTLPSLVAWSTDYRRLVKDVLDSYEKAIATIEIDRVLTAEQKTLMLIGLHCFEGRERLSPIHPLVLSYHLNLVDKISEEKFSNDTFSFGDHLK